MWPLYVTLAQSNNHIYPDLLAWSSARCNNILSTEQQETLHNHRRYRWEWCAASFLWGKEIIEWVDKYDLNKKGECYRLPERVAYISLT